MADLPLTAVCPNCSTEISGPYCPTCGQQHKELKKFFWTLASDAFDDVFQPNSRTSRTLFAVLFKPGYLTSEYFAGRRARYVPPIRLYLIISFLFFFILPLLSGVDADNTNQIIVNDDPTTQEDWRQQLDSETANINLGWLTEEENKQLSEKFRAQIEKTLTLLENDPAELLTGFMDLLSAVMFFLLPVFAIFLKVFYLGSGTYYAEHLLLAVHNHCFLFLALLTSAILELGETTSIAWVTSPMETVIGIWIPVYLYLSMIKVYGQGLFLTAFKFLLLGISYWMLALMGFVTAVIVGVMML